MPATKRVRTNEVDFEFVPCACQPGSRDVSAILIEQGLVVAGRGVLELHDHAAELMVVSALSWPNMPSPL
jgi:hypothetical protein